MEHTATAEVIRRELLAHARSESQLPSTSSKQKQQLPSNIPKSPQKEIRPEVDEKIVRAMTKDVINNVAGPFLTEVQPTKISKSYSTSHVAISKISLAQERPRSSYGRASEPNLLPKRPLSASATDRNTDRVAYEANKTVLHNTLVGQQDKDYALPDDILFEVEKDVNAKVGLKFLKAMSHRPEIYKNIKLKKKKHNKWVPN